MKKLLLALALVAATGLPLSATQYTFGNYDLPVSGAGPLTLQLGGFTGFSPSSLNLTDWLANWTTEPGSDGYYDDTGPEWSVNLALADNSSFAVGQQLYLWAFDTQAGIGSAWALFTDSSWLMAANDGLDPTTYFLEFTAASTAIFGSLDLVGGSASTSIVGAAAVPDAGTTGLLVGLSFLGLAALRQRRLTQVA